MFNLEFHITLYALRRGEDHRDPRIDSEKSFRASRELPLSEEKGLFFHECQLSLLVTGVDEWLWTGYCFVDSYFGTEEGYDEYYAEFDGNPYGRDPATGGTRWLRYPLWNPREYYLWVLSHRMTQATQEWTYLINKFEEGMIKYVSLEQIPFFYIIKFQINR